MHLALVGAVASLFFPLAPGTHWTLRDIDSGARTTISVGKGRVLHGFPGAGDVRVRNVGKTVQAWDAKDGRWEPWFRFGAKKGERYTVRLASTLLWQSVEVRVASKTASARDYHGKTYRGCMRFVFQVPRTRGCGRDRDDVLPARRPGALFGDDDRRPAHLRAASVA